MIDYKLKIMHIVFKCCICRFGPILNGYFEYCPLPYDLNKNLH
jgi:hypothetical protein